MIAPGLILMTYSWRRSMISCAWTSGGMRFVGDGCSFKNTYWCRSPSRLTRPSLCPISIVSCASRQLTLRAAAPPETALGGSLGRDDPREAVPYRSPSWTTGFDLGAGEATHAGHHDGGHMGGFDCGPGHHG